MIKSVKGKLVAALFAMFVVACMCFGISTISNKNSAYAETSEITITAMGANNGNISVFNISGGDASSARGTSIDVYLNDVKTQLPVFDDEGHNYTNAQTLTFVINGLNGSCYQHVCIPKGTKIGDCTLAEEYNFYNLQTANGAFGYLGQEIMTPITITGLNAVDLNHGDGVRSYLALNVAEGVDINVDALYNCNVVYATPDGDITGDYTLYGGTSNDVQVLKESNAIVGLMLNHSVFGAPTTQQRLYKIPAGTLWGGYGGGRYRITNTFYLLYDGTTFRYRNDNPAEERTLEFEGLTNQSESWGQRFIMTLSGGSGSGKFGEKMCDVSVKVDGEAQTAEMWDWGTQYAFYMPYSVLSPEGYHTLEIAGQNLVTGYKFAGVSLSVCDGEVVTPKTIERKGGAYQDYEEKNGTRTMRYVIFFDGFEEQFRYIGDASITVNDETSATAQFFQWDGSYTALLLNVSDYPLNTEYKITVKAGKVGAYYIENEISFYIYNGQISDKKIITPITIERKGGIYHGGLSRYQVYFTDLGGSKEEEIGTVSITVLNTATNKVETDDKFKASALLAWQNDGDGSNAPVSMLMFNASDYPLNTEYKITVKAGMIGNYLINNEVSFYIYNGIISDNPIKEEVKITSMVGVAQDYDNAETDEHLHRYLIYLNFDKEINYNKAYEGLGDVTVTINGVEKTVGMVADELANKRAFLVINYTDAPKDSKNVITIKAGTAFSYYMLTEDFTIRTDGERVYTTLTEMNIECGKEEKDGKTTLKGGVQENLKRYQFYIQTDLTGLTDTMWDGNKCVIDAGTDNERYTTIYYVGGCFGEDDSSIMAILYFNDVVDGATSVSQIGVHSITIKAGTVLNGAGSVCYSVKNDLTIWIGGSYIAENEGDIPELPDGVFYVNQGIENKTLEYTATNIEDYIGEASVVKLKADAEKLSDNNVFFEMPDLMDYCKSLKIVGSNAEPKIKFRSVYTGEKNGVYEDIYLVFEIRSEMDYGNYWGTGMPIVRLRYSGFLASDSAEKDCLWFDFFPNGWSGTPQYATFTNKNFKLEEGKEYFVEFGAVNTTDAQGRDGFTFFVNVIQGDKQAYAECTMTGEYNVSETGDVTIYQSPYKTALIDGDKDPNYKGVVSSFTLMSVDKEREIDGNTMPIGVMSFYNPKIRVAENYDEYDISDIVPIGTGKTYTKIEGDTTSASQSMINATSVRTNNGGYLVRMKIKFTGDDFGCTFAFRGKNTHANSGYTISIAENVVIIGAIQVASPFVTGKTYEIEIGCIDFYIADEITPSGTKVYLKVNGELVAEDTIDKKTGLGTYFCGLVEGAGDSTVTISSAKESATQPDVTLESSRMIVAAGKRTSLSYKISMPTAFDEVEYEIVSGDAEIKDGALYSNTDGKIVVRAKVTNEFGTFYSEGITLNADSGESDSSSDSSSGGGCGSAVDGAVIALPFIAIVAIIMIFKKKERI